MTRMVIAMIIVGLLGCFIAILISMVANTSSINDKEKGAPRILRIINMWYKHIKYRCKDIYVNKFNIDI